MDYFSSVYSLSAQRERPATQKREHSAVPGGSNMAAQFNQAGSFGGDPGFAFDSSSRIIGIGPLTPAFVPLTSTPTAIPSIQIAAGAPFWVQPAFIPTLNGGDVHYTLLNLASTFTGIGPPYGSATQGMDVPLNVFKGFNHSVDPADGFVTATNFVVQSILPTRVIRVAHS